MKKSYFLPILFLFIFSSCLNEDDFGTIDDTLIYGPQISFPWGAPIFSMDDFLENADLDALRVIDTALVADTVPLFLFNDAYYVVPDTLFSEKTEVFDLSAYAEEISSINYLMLRTNAINRIPAELSIQVYFLDQQQEIVNALYPTPLNLDAAVMDKQGNLITARETWKNDVEFSSEDIEGFTEIAYIRVVAVLILEDIHEGENHYYSNQDLWVQIGMRLGFEIEL